MLNPWTPQLTVRNFGPGTATGVRVYIHLSAGLALYDNTHNICPAGFAGGGTCYIEFASLAPGSTSRGLGIQQLRPGPQRVAVEICGATNDPALGNNRYTYEKTLFLPYPTCRDSLPSPFLYFPDAADCRAFAPNAHEALLLASGLDEGEGGLEEPACGGVSGTVKTLLWNSTAACEAWRDALEELFASPKPSPSSSPACTALCPACSGGSPAYLAFPSRSACNTEWMPAVEAALRQAFALTPSPDNAFPFDPTTTAAPGAGTTTPDADTITDTTPDPTPTPDAEASNTTAAPAVDYPLGPLCGCHATAETAVADVKVTLSVSPLTRNMKNGLTGSVSVKNSGPATARGVVVTFSLSTGLGLFDTGLIDCVDGFGGGGICTMSFGDLPPSTLTRSIGVNLIHPGEHTIAAEVCSDSADVLLDNNRVEYTLDLSLTWPHCPLTMNWLYFLPERSCTQFINNIHPLVASADASLTKPYCKAIISDGSFTLMWSSSAECAAYRSELMRNFDPSIAAPGCSKLCSTCAKTSFYLTFSGQCSDWTSALRSNFEPMLAATEAPPDLDKFCEVQLTTPNIPATTSTSSTPNIPATTTSTPNIPATTTTTTTPTPTPSPTTAAPTNPGIFQDLLLYFDADFTLVFQNSPARIATFRNAWRAAMKVVLDTVGSQVGDIVIAEASIVTTNAISSQAGIDALIQAANAGTLCIDPFGFGEDLCAQTTKPLGSASSSSASSNTAAAAGAAGAGVVLLVLVILAVVVARRRRQRKTPVPADGVTNPGYGMADELSRLDGSRTYAELSAQQHADGSYLEPKLGDSSYLEPSTEPNYADLDEFQRSGRPPAADYSEAGYVSNRPSDGSYLAPVKKAARTSAYDLASSSAGPSPYDLADGSSTENPYHMAGRSSSDRDSLVYDVASSANDGYLDVGPEEDGGGGAYDNLFGNGEMRNAPGEYDMLPGAVDDPHAYDLGSAAAEGPSSSSSPAYDLATGASVARVSGSAYAELPAGSGPSAPPAAAYDMASSDF